MLSKLSMINWILTTHGKVCKIRAKKFKSFYLTDWIYLVNKNLTCGRKPEIRDEGVFNPLPGQTSILIKR
ncbi:hypothetical protein PITCH_A1600019 [uncultured Desulfobacterium sp.]|uniref:Uncharacterized protein n=1 Tax=uncultured Desulfobacterium sp. TaxID=201089 RepID=A0A445MU11_9BACT|nr:hypothetical protein PITCH_A1600019 [uncultured Desulfobacterium sp.]